MTFLQFQIIFDAVTFYCIIWILAYLYHKL